MENVLRSQHGNDSDKGRPVRVLSMHLLLNSWCNCVLHVLVLKKFCALLFFRCLFPVLIFTVNGLTRKKDYNIYVRAVSKDQKRYKYLNNKWAPVSDSDVMHDNSRMIAKHPNSPQSGAKWMMRDVDFKSVKITHYSKSKGGDVSHYY